MDVALIHRRFTEHGGTERFLVGLARFLRRRGHMVHVYCNEIRSDLRSEPGITFHHLPMIRFGAIAKVASLYWSSARAARGGHDVVAAFGRTRGHRLYRAGGGAHAAYQIACRPRWWLSPAQWLERWVDRRASTSARRIISPSAMAARDLTGCYGVAPERIRVVPNGVDADRFRPDPEIRAAARRELGLAPDAPALAFLGTGFARKGLADAIAVAREMGLPLFVMGRDAGLARWKRRNPEVHFLGAVQDPERWLPAADVLLLPTRYEPYGNVCLEAMACGVVPVTTRRNGVIEIFPVEGLVGDTVPELQAAVQRALDGGHALKQRCREVAVALTRESAYAQIESALVALANEGGHR